MYMRCLLFICAVYMQSCSVNAASISMKLGNDEKHSIQTRDLSNLINIDEYLQKFGYMQRRLNKPAQSKPGIMNSDADREEGIRKFQEFNGLEVNGILDDETLAKLNQPRCGVKDISEEETGINKPLDFNALGYKWPNKVVKWKATTYTSRLPRATQRSAFEKAFKYWSDVTPLKFEYTTGDPDIDINFATGDHGDGSYNAFDGKGGVLAHAYFPTNGDTHFDDDEKWVYRSNDGTDIETVAIHEFGHALGLSHSDVPESLMAPYYKGYDPNFKLHADDILGIQSLYGKRDGYSSQTTETTTTSKPITTTIPTTTSPSTTTTTTVTTTLPTTTTSSATESPVCEMKFGAISKGPGGFTYVFTGSSVYKLNGFSLEPEFPKSIKSIYPLAPVSLTAAVYINATRKTFLFKGQKVWRYTDFKLDEGFPKYLDVSQFPATIQAGIALKNRWGTQQIYLFGGKYFWELNPQTLKMARGFPRTIASYWRDIPDDVEAAVQLEDNYLYFFKGNKYRKYDIIYGSVVDGYPKPIASDWFKNVC